MPMKLTMESTGEAHRIRSYEAGSITVNESVATRTLLLTPQQMRTDWGPEALPELDTGHLDSVIRMEPEIVLIGTGREQRFPDRRLMARAIQSGIGIEVMATEAACRTYNVLAAEERDVVAILFMIEAGGD